MQLAAVVTSETSYSSARESGATFPSRALTYTFRRLVHLHAIMPHPSPCYSGIILVLYCTVRTCYGASAALFKSRSRRLLCEVPPDALASRILRTSTVPACMALDTESRWGGLITLMYHADRTQCIGDAFMESWAMY